MELETLNYLIIKMRKIEFYERFPMTDSQFISCKTVFEIICRDTKRKYLETSDVRYKYHYINIKKILRNRVSKLEYELCKKIIEDYKASYKDVIKEDYWNCADLLQLKFTILDGEAKTVEEAVYLLER